MATMDSFHKGTVNRPQVLEAVKALGLDPSEILELKITPEAIYVTEIIKDENGRPNITDEKYARRRYSLGIKEAC